MNDSLDIQYLCKTLNNLISLKLDKEGKKRSRSIQKFGVGGFVVRLRGPRLKDDENEGIIVDNAGLNPEMDKPKRKAPRRKIKNKLVEGFPVYLQVC